MRSDVEEIALQKLLQVVMARVISSYALDDPSLQPGPIQGNLLTSNDYASFPNYPRVRQPRKYEADRQGGRRRNDEDDEDDAAEVSPDDFCKKAAYAHASLHPGLRPEFMGCQ